MLLVTATQGRLVGHIAERAPPLDEIQVGLVLLELVSDVELVAVGLRTLSLRVDAALVHLVILMFCHITEQVLVYLVIIGRLGAIVVSLAEIVDFSGRLIIIVDVSRKVQELLPAIHLQRKEHQVLRLDLLLLQKQALELFGGFLARREHVLPLEQVLLSLAQSLVLGVDLFLAPLERLIVFLHLALVHPQLDLGNPQQVADRRALGRLLFQHPRDHALQVLRVPHWNAIHAAVDDLAGQSQVVRGLEGWPEAHDLVEHAA